MNKRAMTGYEQMLLIILILLTITALFFAFSKGDILTKIRNLPGYGYTPEGDEVISGFNDSSATSGLCPIRVGNIKGEDLTKQGNINFCQDIVKQTNCKGDLYAHLKIVGENVQIERTEWYMLWFDTNVGFFKQNTIILMPELLDPNSQQYKILSGSDYYKFADLPLLLKNLDGARIVGADICRDKLITS